MYDNTKILELMGRDHREKVLLTSGQRNKLEEVICNDHGAKKILHAQVL